MKAFLLFLSVPLFCSSVFAREFSLETLPAQIRASHPALEAARLTIEEAKGRADQAGRWANPAVETEFTPSVPLGEGSITIGFSQQFPNADRLRSEKRAATALISAAEAEVREQERLIIAQADALAIRWLVLAEQKPLLQEQKSVGTRLAEVTGRAARAGEGPALDSAQARLDAASATLALRRIQAEMAETTTKLKPLLGLKPEETLTLTGGLPLPLLPTAVTDFTVLPRYHLTRSQWKSAQADVETERLNLKREPTIGFFATVDRSSDEPVGREDEFFAGVRVSVPVPFWDKREGFVREKRAIRDRLQASLATVLHEAIHEAAAARVEMTEAQALLEEIDSKLFPLAEQQVKLAESIYATAEGDVFPVLRAHAQLLQLKQSRLETLESFHLARQKFLSATAQR